MPKISPSRSIQELYAQSNKSRKKVQRPFIAYDGEGVTVESGQHLYVLLMNSEGQQLINEKGIPTQDCFNFLCDSVKEHKQGIHVCFGASYDINMMLRDIPYTKLQELQKGEKVGWKNFLMEYRQRKCFILSRYQPGTKHFLQDEKTGKWYSTHTERIILWDVLGFFQGTFIKALKEFFTSEEEQTFLHIKEIEQGKEARGTFTQEQLETFVVPYTTYEVQALVSLMERLRQYALEAGIVLKRYDGSGAVAASILEKYKVKKYYPTILLEKKKTYGRGELPPQVQLASQHAYAGGRIELCRYGHFQARSEEEAIENDDKISAYPDVLYEVRDLSTALWIHRSRKKTYIDSSTLFGLYKIYWEYPEGLYFYPLFYRDVSHVIRYPRRGYNWVWGPEVYAALKHVDAMNGSIEILEQWECEQNEVRPYAFIPELFEKRKQWKAEGKGAQLPLKLGLSSLYGKTAQRLGYDEESQRLPPFFQLQYAGMTTSKVRADMFEAGIQKPEHVIAFATDGIWLTSQLDLDRGKNLGQWDTTYLSSMTSVQAGVYFAHEQETDKLIYKYRGFNRESLNEEMILQAWRENKTSIALPTTRFITLGTGISSLNRFKTKWRTWETTDRVLRLKPSVTEKRYDTAEWTNNRHPAYGLLHTQVTEAENMKQCHYSKLRDEHLSSKHILPWENEELSAQMEMEVAIKREIFETDV